MRFATHVLLLQLAGVAAVVAVCTGVFAVLGVQQLQAEAQASALGIARTVAEDPEVRRSVADYSADPGTPDAAALRAGDLQRIATGVNARTGALFVVVTDDHGIRLAHPDPDRLGEQVSTSFEEALAGEEVVTWETGTLGESARAKVPVYPLSGERPVGEVSVGFERASVFGDLPVLVGGIAIAVAAALAIGSLVALMVRRRLERLTLGLQPEELVALVQNQSAVLDGVGDGVLALDPQAVVRVGNSAAARLLGVDDPVGKTLAELGLPAELAGGSGGHDGGVGAGGHDDGTSGRERDGIVVGDRVLYLDAHPVSRGRRLLGDVVIVRDRTDLLALSERLESVRAMSTALRVQRHEFANRMHVAAGLLDAGRDADARAFLNDLVERGPVDFAVPGIERVPDAFLQSLLGAKAIEAAERGVTLRVAHDTLLLGSLGDTEDAAAILGNLVDNAVSAAAGAPEPRQVEIALFDDGGGLVMTVADSGPGIDSAAEVFARSRGASAPDAPADTIHGHGFGLPLSRELARRCGGDVWIIDRGGDGAGAVFGARLPGAMRAAEE